MDKLVGYSYLKDVLCNKAWDGQVSLHFSHKVEQEGHLILTTKDWLSRKHMFIRPAMCPFITHSNRK